jgi:hypothetical protein
MWAQAAVCGLLPNNVGRLDGNVGLQGHLLPDNLVPFWSCWWAYVFLLVGRYRYGPVAVRQRSGARRRGDDYGGAHHLETSDARRGACRRGRGAARLQPRPVHGAGPAPGPDFLIIGHRGAPNQACENTLESFAQALRLGANALELDVSITHDGHLVLWHD